MLRYALRIAAGLYLAKLNEGEPEARLCRITGLSRKELALLKRSLPK